MAKAPKVRTNRVQGISELEEETQYRLPTTDDRDIDLSVLTTVLCSSEQVGWLAGWVVDWFVGWSVG